MSRIHEAMKQAAEMAAKAHELPMVEGLTPMTVDEADGLSREPFPIEIGEHLRNRQAEAPEPPPALTMPAAPSLATPVQPLHTTMTAPLPPSVVPPPVQASAVVLPPEPPAPPAMPAAAAVMIPAAPPAAPLPVNATLPLASGAPSPSLPMPTRLPPAVMNAPNGDRERAIDAALDAALERELPPLVPRELPLVPREPRRPLAPAIGTAAMRDRDEGGPVESKHFLDYLRMFYKRRMSAAATFLIVVLGGAVYTWTSTPIFEARVQLMIESERPVVRVFRDETVEAAADKADYQETQNKILASRGLAAKVLDTLGLWGRAEFTGAEQPSGVRRLLIPVVNIGAKVVNRFSMTDWTVRKKEAPEEGETGDRSRVIDTFLDHLTIAPVRNSRLVDVKFQSPDPKLAADISNTLADEYIKQTREFKSKSSKDTSDLLTGQLEEQKTKLLASEAALQRYREQTDTMSTAERDAQLQTRVNELNTQLTRAQADLRAREQTFDQLRKAIDDPKALDIHPTITASAAVQGARNELATLQKREVELKDNLGPLHPELKLLREQIQQAETRVQNERRKVIDAVESELAVARDTERNLTAQADAQKQTSTSMRRKQGEDDALEREVASNRDVFESLLQRTKESGVSSEILASNIRVVDAADVPHTPISPQRFRDMSVAVVAGLALSVLVAFAREYLDKRIKTPDEVKAQLGLPCVGLIPAITRDTPVLSNGVPALFSEAFRALRTSVLFASAEEGAHTLLVTSTGPNEGKTLVAVNLAVSLAQTGRRVLIIDADLRRPTVHKLLGETQEPGMSGITEPGWQVESVIRGTYVENLSMIPAGALPHYPAELLASEAFKQVVKRLAEVYDWVILDSPPVMAVTDAVLIGHLADGVIFVIGSEQTAGPTAVNALEKLHAGHARFLGAVLNKCKLEHDRHYYTHHYRPEYQEYYGVKDN